MNKKLIVIPIVTAVVIFFISISLDDGISSNNIVETNVAFHVTLADPKLYVDGVYTESLEIEKGEYSFRFVPNGSSPEKLSISLSGPSLEFAQDFNLKGTLHETGISEYYTWEYLGQENISIPEMQEITIVIDPNGKTMGSVTVDIIEN